MASELKIKVFDNPLPFLLGGLGGGLGLAGVYYLRGKYRDCKERKELDTKRIDRQIERAEKLFFLAENFKLGQEQLDIVALPFSELVRKLQNRELKCRQVLEAFVAKTVEITQKFNCVTEFVPNMFELADELDALPTVRGPLHGVPYCVKDCHDIKGMDSTLGYSKNLNKPASKNCVVVQVLGDAGAIVFCKTNFPQTLFSYASENPIYGTTYNHLNKQLSPGGSSSGTGCLVGAGGAPFGTGSDIGGSVRIPAQFSGITALRPTINRISGKGVTQCLQRCAGFVGVSGMLAPNADTLASIYKIMTTDAIQNVYDPQTVPIPWNEKDFQSKEPLRIGYFTSFPFFPPLGDIPQVVMNAKSTLETMGHTMIPFELPDTWNIARVFSALAGADGGTQFYEHLRNDKVSYPGEKFMLGRTILSRLSLTLKSFFKPKTLRHVVGDPAAQNSIVLWEYLAIQQALKEEVLEKMKQLNLDLILTSVYPFPATRVDDAETLLPALIQTAVWNLLDFPAGVVPFGKESCSNIDSYDDQGDFLLKLAKEGIRFAKDMPIGVQIVGKPFHEEVVLRIMTQLDKSNN